MAKLPIVSGAQAVKAMQRLGFYVDRQRGSHAVLKKFTPKGERGCVIPMHREVALGTLRSALKMAGACLLSMNATVQQRPLFKLRCGISLLALVAATVIAPPAFAGDYTNYIQLFSFNGTNGANPSGDLTEGADGFLYGTTSGGGITNMTFPGGAGVAFRIDKSGCDYQVLHFFGDRSNDGEAPNSALAQDSNGVFFGTAVYGGSNGLGAVFAMNSDGTGYRLLKSFAGGANDGEYPQGGVIIGLDGSIYGTASSANYQNTGLAYKLARDGSSYSVLSLLFQQFDTNGDGECAVLPSGSLLQTPNGHLFGGSSSGNEDYLDGEGAHGSIFTLDEAGANLLVNASTFALPGLFIPYPVDPYGTLVDAHNGYLYGTTSGGGLNFQGSVFQIPADGSSLAYAEIADLGGESFSAIELPNGGLILGPDGALYGTASFSEFDLSTESQPSGGVYRVTTNGALTVLKVFSSAGDGNSPIGRVLLATDAGLYGVTSGGGAYELGAVYAIYSNSRAWFANVNLNGRTLSLETVATTGTSFRLQFLPDLSQTNWSDIATNAANGIGPVIYSNIVPSFGSGFYRLQKP